MGNVHNDNDEFSFAAGTMHNDNVEFSFALCTTINTSFFSFALCTTINMSFLALCTAITTSFTVHNDNDLFSFACERKLVIIVVHNARCRLLGQTRVKDRVAMQYLKEMIMAVIHQGDASP